MIKNIAIAVSTMLLFALMAWTTIAAPSQEALRAIMQTPVTYELPYPGLLPDTILYPLKTLRDRVIRFFISNPQKQAAFDLLQADKRLAAGEYLLAEKNPNAPLISQTVSKGENYFGDAIMRIKIAQHEGMLTNDFLGKLQNAAIKHQQVLYTMAMKTQGTLKENLLEDITRVQGFEDEVRNLLPHE